MPFKILVVDDNLGASKLVENVLAQHFNGGDVLVAQRGADAFERFNVAQPDAIVLNDTLPDMEAEAVCYRLLNEPATAKVPVLVMAEDGKAEWIQDRYTNVSKVVDKPVSADGLQTALAAALPKQPRPGMSPARSLLFYDPSQTVFSVHTGFFTLRAALQMAY